MNPLWHPIVRLLWLVLILTRLRDRMRCPKCKAVGTYKLHAPCKGDQGQKRPWRWLCKWCGFYKAEDGRGFLCYPSKSREVWAFFSDNLIGDRKETPYVLFQRKMPWVWPWRG